VNRVWDIYLHEGPRIIFKVAIAIMIQRESLLLKLPFEQILAELQTIHKGLDAQEVIYSALAVQLTEEQFTALSRQHAEEQSGDITPKPISRSRSDESGKPRKTVSIGESAFGGSQRGTNVSSKTPSKVPSSRTKKDVGTTSRAEEKNVAISENTANTTEKKIIGGADAHIISPSHPDAADQGRSTMKAAEKPA